MKPLALMGVLALIGVSVNTSLSWSDMAAMVVVFGAVSGAVQWVISRAIVQPALTKSAEATREWAEQEFASKLALELHVNEDSKEFDRIWRHLE